MIPIVLHHGLFGFDEVRLGRFRMSYFHRIDQALAERGHVLIVPRVHPTGGVARRARQLKEAILRQVQILGLQGRRLLVLGHSMGGLDARYMISRLGMAGHVEALVTIATPHRGSPYADWCIRHLGRRLGALELFSFMGLDMQGAIDVTTERCRRFNEQVPDIPGVRYFSVTAARPWLMIPPFAIHSHKIIADAEGDNDGLVSVRSAIWGEHLCTWHADHWRTVNRRFALEFGDCARDITPFYLKMMDDLAARGVPVG